MTLRRISFAVVLLAFVGAFVWRVTWFPYQAETLIAAMPPQALCVGEHARLAARWPALIRHPLVRSAALAMGVPSATLDTLARDPGTQAVLDRLAARSTVVAYVPSIGRRGQPAWVASSWVGLQGQLMRWGFYDSALAGFHSHVFPGGRKGWVLEGVGGPGSRQSLALAVTEGVLLACLSEDPDAISILLYRVENRVPGLKTLGSPAVEGDGAGPVRDRFIFGDLGGLYAALGDSMGVWSVDLSVGTNAVEGEIRGPAGVVPGLETERGWAAVAGLSQVLHASPGALLIAPAEVLAVAGRGLPPPTGEAVTVLWDQLRALAVPGGRVFVSVCKPSYSGRIMGFKVATAMLGIELADPAAAEAVIGSALDAFNAHFSTTLIRTPVPDAPAGLSTVESVRRGPLSGLGAGERPSYAITNGWLIVASNRDVLEGVLRAPEPPGAPSWARDLAVGRGAAMGWVDLGDAAESLRKITAIYDLLMIAQGGAREPTVARERMAMAQAWLDEVRPLGCLRLGGGVQDGACRVRFRLGPAPEMRGDSQKDLSDPNGVR